MEAGGTDTAQRRIGSVLRDRWVLERVVGAGGTATVYEGVHRTNGRRVAIKVLHAHLASSEDVVARFHREGYLANKVGHRGAVAILDDDVTPDGAPFLVMELLTGEPMTRLLERERAGLAPARVLAIAAEVLDVLAAAHAQGITHRDVKPDNVFLTSDGGVKLLDFGIARLTHGVSFTMDGSAIGTPQYMAPEQARGRWSEVDAQSDLWSVGALMFRALAGRHVRSAPTSAELLMKAMTESAPLLASVAPGVPPVVAEIVDRALATDKAERWPDAHAMQEAVRAAAASLGSPLDAPSVAPMESRTYAPPRAPERETRGVRARVMFAGAAFVAVAVFIAWQPMTARVRPPPRIDAPAAAAPPRAEPAATAPPIPDEPPPPELPASQEPAPPPPPAPTTDLGPSPDPLAPRPVERRRLRPRPRPSTPNATPTPSSPGDGYSPPTRTEVTTSPTSPLERRH